MQIGPIIEFCECIIVLLPYIAGGKHVYFLYES